MQNKTANRIIDEQQQTVNLYSFQNPKKKVDELLTMGKSFEEIFTEKNEQQRDVVKVLAKKENVFDRIETI